MTVGSFPQRSLPQGFIGDALIKNSSLSLAAWHDDVGDAAGEGVHPLGARDAVGGLEVVVEEEADAIVLPRLEGEGDAAAEAYAVAGVDGCRREVEARVVEIAGEEFRADEPASGERI